MKILVIEDDRIVRTLIHHVLEGEGYDTDMADNAAKGEQLVFENKYDLIILDLGLPDKSGLEVCKTIRDNHNQTPVIILSAYQSVETKITGLGTGADDYLTKPFDKKELIARINAVTRRFRSRVADDNLFECGELKVDLVKRVFYVRNKSITLTNNEFNLIAFFLKNPDRVLNKEELVQNVWGINYETNTNFLNVYISYIRKKIQQETAANYIQTVRKKGFMLVSNPERDKN